MTARTFTVAVLGVAFVLAGALSHYASGLPDGLEHVASSLGFSSTAGESLTSGGPLAGYAVTGVDSVRISGGVAGVLGCIACFAVVSLATRRRPSRSRS